MHLIVGNENGNTDLKSKGAFIVTTSGLLNGFDRTTTLTYKLPKAVAKAFVERLVSKNALNDKGVPSQNEVSVGELGGMTITELDVQYFDADGAGYDVTISKVREAKGDVDGCWNQKERSKKAKAVRKAKASGVEVED